MRMPVATHPADSKSVGLASTAVLALQAAGRLVLVASLLPVGFADPGRSELPRQVVMEAARVRQPQPAEPPQVGSSHAAAVPIGRPASANRFETGIGRLVPRPALVRLLLCHSHVSDVGRNAPDPPHLPAALWRAPPRLPT